MEAMKAETDSDEEAHPITSPGACRDEYIVPVPLPVLVKSEIQWDEECDVPVIKEEVDDDVNAEEDDECQDSFEAPPCEQTDSSINVVCTTECREDGDSPVDMPVEDTSSKLSTATKDVKAKSNNVAHTEEEFYKCAVCNKNFTSRKTFVDHTKNHNKVKRYHCDVCGKSFANPSVLKRHAYSHTGDKPIKCPMCDKSFAWRSNYVQHTRTHTGERPFRCELCNKTFTLKSNLMVHTRTHTGDKPFKCKTCNKSFGHHTSLVHHIRVHTGVKPFKCEYCDNRSYTYRKNLVAHTRNHHPAQFEESQS